MNITVINGTQFKGCTYHIKERFLDELREGNTITEFYLPKDMPYFCTGCKKCFFEGEEFCPHGEAVQTIFDNMLQSELILFAYPVYVLRAPGQVKALLDHFACHWMPHRPKEELFSKKVVIITQSIGAPNGPAQKDVLTSMNWMGISHVKTLGFGLREGIIWEEISEKRKDQIKQKIVKFARDYQGISQANMSLKIKGIFHLNKMMRKAILKNEKERTLDSQYWIDKGWL